VVLELLRPKRSAWPHLHCFVWQSEHIKLGFFRFGAFFYAGEPVSPTTDQPEYRAVGHPL